MPQRHLNCTRRHRAASPFAGKNLPAAERRQAHPRPERRQHIPAPFVGARRLSASPGVLGRPAVRRLMSRLHSPDPRPGLRRLLTGYAVSGLGDWFGEIALSVLVFHETGSVLAVTAIWIAGRSPSADRSAARRAPRGTRVSVIYGAEAACSASSPSPPR